MIVQCTWTVSRTILGCPVGYIAVLQNHSSGSSYYCHVSPSTDPVLNCWDILTTAQGLSAGSPCTSSNARYGSRDIWGCHSSLSSNRFFLPIAFQPCNATLWIKQMLCRLRSYPCHYKIIVKIFFFSFVVSFCTHIFMCITQTWMYFVFQNASICKMAERFVWMLFNKF